MKVAPLLLLFKTILSTSPSDKKITYWPLFDFPFCNLESIPEIEERTIALNKFSFKKSPTK